MNATLFAQYLVAVSVLVLMPGPDMLFCLACGIAGGPRAGLAAALGTATGEAVHVTASACGLAVLVDAVPSTLTWLRIAGAVVLVALSIQTLTTSGRRTPDRPLAPLTCAGS